MSKSTDFQVLLNKYRDVVIDTRYALNCGDRDYRKLLTIECGIAQEIQEMYETELKKCE